MPTPANAIASAKACTMNDQREILDREAGVLLSDI